MSVHKSIYLYSLKKVVDAQKVVEEFQESFNEILEEEFSATELEKYESKLDELSHIYAQPIFTEISFNDFEVEEKNYDRFKFIFESCKSCIVIENLGDLYLNPFQVSYIMELFRSFDEGLVDLGNFRPLQDKENFEKSLRGYKNMMSLVTHTVPEIKKINIDASPVERDLTEVRKLLRADHLNLEMPDKTKILLKTIWENQADAGSGSLLKESGLNPKDFSDHMEKLKFILKNLA